MTKPPATRGDLIWAKLRALKDENFRSWDRIFCETWPAATHAEAIRQKSLLIQKGAIPALTSTGASALDPSEIGAAVARLPEAPRRAGNANRRFGRLSV
jgi:hypothetical protein